MRPLLALIVLLLAVSLSAGARAEPADVDAAARGVVRVVVIGSDGQRIYPISHGTGFAVSPTRIVTNSHVVREARADDRLRVGIVPPDGGDAVYARVIAVDERIDLALLETTGGLRLPPLGIAGGAPPSSGSVSAVGYPMNVDRAQGLEIADIFRPQPPVKSQGTLSGARPSRQFDTILHTAPIARGNSGGPLLDPCGRVVGVNSFGADAGGSDAEFFFAVSTRELLPFLRENDVDFSSSTLPCRSLAELDTEERERLERRRELAARTEQLELERARERREIAYRTAQFSVLEERENHVALAFVLGFLAIGAGAFAQSQRGRAGRERWLAGGAAIAGVAAIGALAAWFTRPGIDAVEERAADLAGEEDGALPAVGTRQADAGRFVCRFEPMRSRITQAQGEDIDLAWSPDGCVNGRTQYGSGLAGWQRVFAPRDEATVTVSSYDPETRTFRTDRYLLGRELLERVRAARQAYDVPECGTEGGARLLAERQQAVLTLLPEFPNERLVYSCEPAPR
jgi:hypothetical protein